MKRIWLILVLVIMFSPAFSQKSEVKITTKYDDFEVYIGNKEYSEGFDDIAKFEIAPGKYLFRITFDNDTVADIIKKIKIKPSKIYNFEIKPKDKIAKTITKTSRKINNTDYNDKKLTDYYYLDLIETKDK
jgi:ABC-type antimicrobial peptide transport system permease subunit